MIDTAGYHGAARLGRGARGTTTRRARDRGLHSLSLTGADWRASARSRAHSPSSLLISLLAAAAGLVLLLCSQAIFAEAWQLQLQHTKKCVLFAEYHHAHVHNKGFQ